MRDDFCVEGDRATQTIDVLLVKSPPPEPLPGVFGALATWVRSARTLASRFPLMPAPPQSRFRVEVHDRATGRLIADYDWAENAGHAQRHAESLANRAAHLSRAEFLEEIAPPL
jgi:hypothetical protein